MSAKTPKEPCRSIFLHAFRGNRSVEFRKQFDQKLEEEKEGKGPGPTLEECLLYAGHVGISFHGEKTIYGFKPTLGEGPVWQLLEDLKSGKAFPGEVSEDTAVFEEARRRGLTVYSVEYVYPESVFQEIYRRFLAEQKETSLAYSFPGGTGDCNCATWPDRIGIPLPEETGLMLFFVEAMLQMDSPQQMGDCEG